MPILSVIIPVYNVEQYLDTCIKSIINQTLKDIEIILVNDGSLDKSPQMCDEYAKGDKRIKVIHKKNEGLGLTRNRGIEFATGEYITFIDSDDFININAYKNLYSIIQSNNLDVAYYYYQRFNNENKVLDSTFTDSTDIYNKNEISGLMLDMIASDISSKQDHTIACSSCTAIYRASIIKEHNIRFHSERELISEDLIFNLDFLKNAKRVAINRSEYYYYRNNLISLSNKVRKDWIEKIHSMYDYINNNSKNWQLNNKELRQRNIRLFIGNCRYAIIRYLSSTLSIQQKKEWLNNELKRPIWNEIYNTYKWKNLPTFPRIFFFLSVKNQINTLILISYLHFILVRISKMIKC